MDQAASPDSRKGIAAVVDGLGDQFEPLLRDACGGRLGPISWFRADWQRGGARTGRSTFTINDESQVSVVVKIPVGPVEHLWHQRLQPDEDDPYGVTATLFAAGTTLAGYDLAWLVMERFPEGPLFGLKRVDAMELMADAAARFHKRASIYPVDREPRSEDWTHLLAVARDHIQTNKPANESRWKKSIKQVQKLADSLVDEWHERPITGWCHGDLHPANAMSRSDRSEDPAMLIDLAEVRPGHWIEDAVYLERLFWPRRDYLDQHPPVRLIARHRHALGLEDENGRTTRLVDLRRSLLAATAPAFLSTEGNPRYLQACLEMLETVIPRLRGG